MVKHPKKPNATGALVHRLNPFTKSWEIWDSTHEYWVSVGMDSGPDSSWNDVEVSFVSTWCEPVNETW